MTPPTESDIGIDADASEIPSAVSVCLIDTLKNRADFLRAAQARR